MSTFCRGAQWGTICGKHIDCLLTLLHEDGHLQLQRWFVSALSTPLCPSDLPGFTVEEPSAA